MDNQFQKQLDSDELMQGWNKYNSLVEQVLDLMTRAHGEHAYMGLQGRWEGPEFNEFVEFANPKWDIVADALYWFYEEGIKLKNIILSYQEMPPVEADPNFVAALRTKLELSEGTKRTWNELNTAYIGYMEQEKNTAYNGFAAALWIQSEVFWNSDSSALQEWSTNYGQLKHEKTETIFNTIQEIYDKANALDRKVAELEGKAINAATTGNN